MTQTQTTLGPTTGQKLGAALLSFLLFMSLLAFSLLLSARWITRQETVSSILVEQNVTELPVGNPEGGASLTISQLVYSMFPPELWQELGLTESTFQEYLTEGTWVEFFADTAGGIIQDITDGSSTTSVSAADYERLIIENDPVLESITGSPMPEEYRPLFAQTLAGGENSAPLSAATFTQGSIGEMLAFVRPFVSQTMTIIVGALVVLLVLAIIFTLQRRYRWYAPNLAVPLIFVGLMLLAARVVSAFLSNNTLTGSTAGQIGSAFFAALADRFFLFGLIALGLGIILLIVRALTAKRSGTARPANDPGSVNPYMD